MSNISRILIVDDEESMRHMLSLLLKDEGYDPVAVANGKDALKLLLSEKFHMVLCDIRMPKMDGMSVLKSVIQEGIKTPIIMMSAYGDANTAVDALDLGAVDYISKPFKTDEIVLAIRKAEQRGDLTQRPTIAFDEIMDVSGVDGIVTQNEEMQSIFTTIKKVANYKSTVLITGESGTGKELVARAIHEHSKRKAYTFIAINCGAMPENLLESELFGHAKGAFTGATVTKKGLFVEASSGTLFLDEIGELPIQLQVKLLRVLQEGEVRPVGDTRHIPVDVRIIAATGKDIEEEVKEKRFREDLFYRLNVVPIHIPALRDRKEDIPILVNHFIDQYNKHLGVNFSGISQEALNYFLAAFWKGNIRELEHVIERIMVMSEGPEINLEDLPTYLTDIELDEGSPLDIAVRINEKVASKLGEGLSIKKSVRELEEELIRRALEKTGGNRTQAAKILEISHRALLYKIKEYGI